ncbi:MAG: alpha/beta fold hydrolase [Planctomycetota bacterium]
MNAEFLSAEKRDTSPLPASRPLSDDMSLEVRELRFSDGAATPVWRVRSCEGCPGLPLLYLHGIQSHPGWFVGSAQALAREGWDVFLLTRRGSGTSTAPRGDAPSADRLMTDLTELAELLLRETRAETLSAVGVSWGGKWLSAWLAGGRSAVSAATLVAPGIAPRVDVSWTTKLAIAGSLLCVPTRQFEIPLGDPELFTETPAMQRYIADDKASLRRATARFLYASRKMEDRLKHSPADAISTPTTLLLAETDRIIDNDRTRRIFEKLTGSRGQTHTLSGAHTLEFEPDPQPFYDALVSSLAPGVPTDEAS